MECRIGRSVIHRLHISSLNDHVQSIERTRTELGRFSTLQLKLVRCGIPKVSPWKRIAWHKGVRASATSHEFDFVQERFISSDYYSTLFTKPIF